jgi:5-methylcytosine-specific restriction endonuclease McrA
MVFEELRAEARRFVVWNLASQGLTGGQIARTLGVPKGTVRRMLKEGKRERERQRAFEEAYGAWCLNAAREIPAAVLARRSREAAQRVYAYGGTVEETVDLAAVIERDKACCHICKQPVEPIELAFDHVVPLVLGGTHATANVRVAHARCNSEKGARL